jgi:hypothetical protein
MTIRKTRQESELKKEEEDPTLVFFLFFRMLLFLFPFVCLLQSVACLVTPSIIMNANMEQTRIKQRWLQCLLTSFIIIWEKEH